MSPEVYQRIEYLAAMVASGGASESENSELETLLQNNPEARAMANEFSEAMTEFALTQYYVDPPSNGLESVRAAILETVRYMPPASAQSSVIPLFAKSPRKNLWVASTGLLLAVAAAFAVLWNQADSRSKQQAKAVEELSNTLALVKNDLSAIDQEWSDRHKSYRQLAETKLAKMELLRSPTLTLATLHKDAGATIKIFREPAGKRWLVYGFDLPEIPEKDYQLWFIPTSGDPIPAGVFVSLGGGLHELEVILPSELTEITQAAVSLEQKGGVKSPTDVKLIGPI